MMLCFNTLCKEMTVKKKSTLSISMVSERKVAILIYPLSIACLYFDVSLKTASNRSWFVRNILSVFTTVPWDKINISYYTFQRSNNTPITCVDLKGGTDSLLDYLKLLKHSTITEICKEPTPNRIIALNPPPYPTLGNTSGSKHASKHPKYFYS